MVAEAPESAVQLSLAIADIHIVDSRLMDPVDWKFPGAHSAIVTLTGDR